MKIIVEGRTFTLDIFTPEAIQEAAALLAQDKTILFGLVNVIIEPRDHPAAEPLRKALHSHIYSLGNSSDDVLLGVRNIISNAPTLLRCPSVMEVPPISAPVICVGAAPSLAMHLDRLRVLQKSCLIICADTILGGLMSEGIFPHLVTPMERTPDMPDRLPKDPGDTCWAGAAVFDPRGLARFKSHYLINQCGPIADWLGSKGMAYGASTGTMSAAVGLQLSTGPVYLVGHDLSFPADADSHWSPATAIRCNQEFSRDQEMIEDHNGGQLPSIRLFRMYGTDFSLMAMAHGRLHNVNAFHKIGALIPGAIASDLPEPGPDLNWTPPARIGDERLEAFHQRLVEADEGIATAIQRVRASDSIEAMQVDTLGNGTFRSLLEVIMRPVFVQFSMERHMGAPEKVVLPALKDAMTRVLNLTAKTLKEAHAHAV